MSAIEETERELNAMLDEGVRVVLNAGPDGGYRLRVLLDDAACGECLVPDQTLSVIAADTLRRHGTQVSSVSVDHSPDDGPDHSPDDGD